MSEHMETVFAQYDLSKDTNIKRYNDYKMMLKEIDKIIELAEEKKVKVSACHQKHFSVADMKNMGLKEVTSNVCGNGNTSKIIIG